VHILVVTDQHPASLGGAQVAIRTQRAALERLGHRVSIAAPALHRRGYVATAEDRAAYIDLPSMPITTDREYALSWPSRRTDRALAAALRSRPPVDLVHVQGDFWGAMIGLRAARGLNAARRLEAARGSTPTRRPRVPLVFTMHNNVDHGTRAVTPLAPFAFLGLRAWRSLSLGRARGTMSPRAHGAWRYLAELAAEADAVIAPSQHFANQLERHGVADRVEVVRGGVDDAVIERMRSSPRTERERPKLIWLGRMSHEKRVLEFIEALARSGVNADATLYGAGLLLRRVQERVAQLGLQDRVVVAGPVPHGEALAAIRDADALVQTSIGFETQGLTPFEAALLGTPTIFSDPLIAHDAAITPSWLVADPSVDALATTLREAVDAIARAPRELRVDDAVTRGFLQSEQTKLLVEIYERVLSE